MNKKKTLEEICIENSTYARKDLKRRLFEENIKEKKCEDCGIQEQWNGKKLSLTLDHINGVKNDNRLENLRILCPNCHSQTDTFAGRNCKREKKVHYCNCGNIKKTRDSKKCVKCEALRKRKVVNRPNRTEILEEIKQFGYRGTARKYNVSDNCIRAWSLK